MGWTELKTEEVSTSKGVTLKIAISENDKGTKIFGIRKWIQRNGADAIPTKDGFAVTLSNDTIEGLIDALTAVKEWNA